MSSQKLINIPPGMKELSKYPNYYISEDGKVYSSKSKKFLNLCKPKNGYANYYTIGNKHDTIYRLVAEEYIQNPQGLQYIHHIDGDKSNNHYSNLEWSSCRTSQKITCIPSGMKELSKYPKYYISEDGKVYSSKSNMFLNPSKTLHRHSTVSLNVNKSIAIYRLVAEEFVPNPFNYKYVHHIDGDKSNNHYSNLKWTKCSQYGGISSVPAGMKQMEEYPTYYISKNGEIYSIKIGGLLKIGKTCDGYLRCTLNDKLLLVHRLVAKIFVPNPLKLNIVNHIDGNKSNNNFINLEWCTYSQNAQHAFDIGLNKGNKGRSVLCFDMQGKLIKRYEKIIDASNDVNISATNITKVCKGKATAAAGFIWKYENEENCIEPKNLKDWKFIPEYKNYYQISRDGKIWSLRGNKLLIPKKLACGKYSSCLCKNGKEIKKMQHHLVALTYILNPSNFKVVRFIDGNNENCVVENLEWCDLSTAFVASRKRGTPNSGVRQYDMKGVFIQSFPSAMEASRSVGLNNGSHIIGCCLGKNHSAKNFRWTYSTKQEVNKTEKASGKSKKIVQIDTQTGEKIAIFNSGAEAKRSLGKTALDISAVCRGTRETAGGFKWMFLEDFEKI